eukprot:6591474-Alexandrium_andersonii.AAC.1
MAPPEAPYSAQAFFRAPNRGGVLPPPAGGWDPDASSSDSEGEFVSLSDGLSDWGGGGEPDDSLEPSELEEQ